MKLKEKHACQCQPENTTSLAELMAPRHFHQIEDCCLLQTVSAYRSFNVYLKSDLTTAQILNVAETFVHGEQNFLEERDC